jgi:hypothetical protein
VTLTAVALVGALARYAKPLPMTAGVASLTLLGLVHQPYDAVILLTPVIFALPRVGAWVAAKWRDDDPAQLSRVDLLTWALAAVPVAHLHHVTTLVVPATAADLIDVAALALCAALAVASLAGQRPRSTATLP